MHVAILAHLRNFICAIAVTLLAANYSYATYAAVVPSVVPATTGAVTTIATSTVAAGYALWNGTLAIAGASITIPLGAKVLAASGVLAASALAPYVLGGLTLGIAAGAAIDWLNRSHAAGVALDLVYDPITDKIVKKIGGSDPPPFTGEIRNPANFDLAQLRNTQNNQLFPAWIAGRMADSSDSGNRVCALNVVDISQPFNDGCGPGQASVYVNVCQNTKGWVGGMCVGPNGSSWATNQPPSYVPGTQEQLDALSVIPVDPRIFPALGKPVPIDPTTAVLNPPINGNNNSIPIGPTSPAPTQPSQPIRIADGEPIPIPGTAPQQYTQPWQEIVHSPTADEPWRVDIRPVTTIVTSPTAPTAPVTVPNTGTGNPSAGAAQTDCDKYPGSLGCAPLGTPPTGEIPKSTREITLQQGPQFAGGACPADVMLSIHGSSIKALDIQQACGWVVNWVKPLVLLLAAISAVFIVYPKGD